MPTRPPNPLLVGETKPRALIVDDDQAFRAICARALDAQGFAVESVADAKAALRVVGRGSFDVMISDIHMPGMSGVELVAQLRKLNIDIPVVLMTGDPEVQTAVEAIEYGVLRYLTKPVTPNELLVVVHSVVRLHGLARAERAALDNEALRSLTDELRRSKDAALAGTRAKNEFLSKMGHELRTPMTAIIGMTELTLATELTAEQREYLETVRTSSESLMGVISSVLDFASMAGRTLQLEPQSFNLRDTIEQSVKRLRFAAAAKQLALLSEVGADVPELLVGDPVRFGQVIDALLSNAFKFTEKGAIKVNVQLEVHPDTSQARICVSISDTGVGIAKDALVRVGEAFSQGDDSSTRAFGGSGLGLTIAAELVALMNGSLSIESTPGIGTTVRFTACLGLVREKDSFLILNTYGT
jgi:signal transduction histidine kinase